MIICIDICLLVVINIIIIMIIAVGINAIEFNCNAVYLNKLSNNNI